MKTVVDDFIRTKNKIGQRITPIYLYEIQYDSTGNNWLYWTSAPVNITFDSQTYTKQVITHTSFKENSAGFVEGTKLKIGNGDRVIQYYLDNYQGLKNCLVNVKLVWLEAISNSLCYIEWKFKVESASSDEEYAEIAVTSIFNSIEIMIPRRTFHRFRCQYAKFKDSDCGYSGTVASCDRMQATCDALGNIARFGAFPGVPLSFGKFSIE